MTTFKIKLKRKQPEHDEQVALFEWARMNEKKYPQLKFMFAIPNGGARHPAVARKLKAEGVKPGVPDIFLPVPAPCGRTSYGLFIEMKSGKNKLSQAQKIFREYLTCAQYTHVICYSWGEAKSEILFYLGLLGSPANPHAPPEQTINCGCR